MGGVAEWVFYPPKGYVLAYRHLGDEGVLWLKGRMKGCPRAIPQLSPATASALTH